MGFFSFNNDFEVLVNQPRADTYEKFISHIKGKGWRILSSVNAEEISFKTKMTLLSYAIDFVVEFTSIDDKSTKLSVSASAGHFDMGRSKGIINDIIKNIY